MALDAMLERWTKDRTHPLFARASVVRVLEIILARRHKRRAQLTNRIIVKEHAEGYGGAMPRLRQVPRSPTNAPVVTRMYDMLFGRRDPVAEPGTATGTPGDWWTVFALVPDVLDHAVRGFALYRSPQRVLDPGLRELGQTRAGYVVGSQFVFSQHAKACRHLGMSDAKIEAIACWSASELFTPTERLVLAYTDALALEHGRVHDALFEALKGALSDEAILELTYITTLYVQHAIMSRALRVEYDDRPDPIVEVAAPSGADARDIGADIRGGS